MYRVLFTLHSWLRWLVLLVAVAAFVKHLIGLLNKQPYDKAASGLKSAFSGLMDLQVTLGLVFLFTNWSIFSAQAGGGLPRIQIEHLVVMVIAAVVAHLVGRKKDQPDLARYKNNLIGIVVAVLLVLAGIFTLGAGRLLAFRF